MRYIVTLVALSIAALMLAPPAGADTSASAGYAAVAPSIVRIWTFDAKRNVVATATGYVVESDDQHAIILTAFHAVKGAASISVDAHEARAQPATLRSSDPINDIALLEIKHGNLKAVTFASKLINVGDTIAATGYYKSEAETNQSRLLFPGTISSLQKEDKVLAFDNLPIQEGLSGGPIFDASTGAVLGMVVSRTDDGRGGFALSAPIVLIGFLRDAGVQLNLDGQGRVTLVQPHPTPTPPAECSASNPNGVVPESVSAFWSPLQRASAWATVETSGGQTWDGVWTFTDCMHTTVSAVWVNRTTHVRITQAKMFVKLDNGVFNAARLGLGQYKGIITKDGASIVNGSFDWATGTFTATPILDAPPPASTQAQPVTLLSAPK